MPIVLSEHTLPELESLLAEVKHEICEREGSTSPAETLPAEVPNPAPGENPDRTAVLDPADQATTDDKRLRLTKSGTLRKPSPPPSVPSAAAPPAADEGHAADSAAGDTQTTAPSPTDVHVPRAQPQAQPQEEAPAAVIRYVHPASRTLTWTGEGSTPDWITAYLAHGGSWSAMENAAEKLAASHRSSSRILQGGIIPPKRSS